MYVYRADTWCDSCGEKIQADLLAEGLAPEDPEDERSYDSDHFPKGPYPLEATDSPDHCASVGDCLEAIDLAEYGLADDATLYGAECRKIGALLSEGLTEYGVDYLREMMAPDEIHYTQGIGSGATHTRESTPYQLALYELWREVFSDELG